MNKYLFALALLFVVSADQDVDSSIQQFTPSILDELQNLPGSLASHSLQSLQEGEDIIRKKCLRNGYNESADTIVEGRERAKLCFRDVIDFETIKGEIEQAKPKGELDTVFKKYCRKIPELKSCISNYTSAWEKCLGPKELETKKVGQGISDSLFNFICHKEGDRIALFIAEGGPDCLKSKFDAIQNCVNTSFYEYIPNRNESSSPELEDLPELTLDEEHCQDVNVLQHCVVTELEGCDEPTPANIVESLFNYIIKSTPCSKFKNVHSGRTSSAHVVTLSFSSLFIAVILSSIVNIFN